MKDRNYYLDVGDVVLIQTPGHGFVGRDVGKYVEITGYGDYFGDAGVTVKRYDKAIETVDCGDDDGVVGYGSFGDKPMILLNTNDEFVDVKEKSVEDFVNKPSHYQLFYKDDIEGDFIEVKHVVKAVLERWEEQDKISFDFYQAGCYKELLQYLLRAPLKNNIEDVQKAEYYLKEIINEW